MPALRLTGIGGRAGCLLPLETCIRRRELVLVLATQVLELDTRRVGRLNVVLQRVRISGYVTLERTEPVEGDGERGDAQHNPCHFADRRQVPTERRPGRRALGQQSEDEQGQGEPNGIKERDHNGRAPNAMVVGRHGDGREHRAGAGDEDGSEAEAEKEATTLGGVARGTQPGERPLDELAYSGNHQPDRDRTEHGHTQPEEEVLREVEETQQRRGEKHGQAEAQDKAGDDEEWPGAVAARRAARQDNRDHRNDAGREPGDQPAQERDDNELSHRRRIPSVALPLALLGSLPRSNLAGRSR
jgi:hypothetical protein